VNLSHICHMNGKEKLCFSLKGRFTANETMKCVQELGCCWTPGESPGTVKSQNHWCLYNIMWDGLLQFYILTYKCPIHYMTVHMAHLNARSLNHRGTLKAGHLDQPLMLAPTSKRLQDEESHHRLSEVVHKNGSRANWREYNWLIT